MLRVLRNSSFYRNILMMFSGSVLSQLINVVSIPILTRLFVPEEFGVYQLFLALVNVLSMVSTGRYEMAIIIPRYRMQAVHVLFLTLGISCVVSIVLEMIFLLSGASFDVFQGIALQEYAMYVPVYILLVSFYQALYLWFIREQKYRFISYVLVLYSFCNMGICVLLYYLGIETQALVKAIVLARAIEVACLGTAFIKDYGRYVKLFSWRRLIAFSRKYQDFPKYMIAGGGVDALATSVPSFFINTFFGTRVTGYYSLANQCLSLPSALVAKSIGDVFKQEASRIYQRQKQCHKFYLKNFRLLLKVAVISGGMIVFLAPTCFAVFFGEEWRISGQYAQLLALFACSSLIASPLSNIYIVAQKQKQYFGIQIVYLLAAGCSMFVGGYFFCDMNATLWVLSGAFFVANGISLYWGNIIAKGC